MGQQSMSATDRIWTPANIVTMTRILFIPVFMLLALLSASVYGSNGEVVRSWAAGISFLALSLTDGIDGYLARSRNEVSTFGKLIDPIADKVLVMAAFLVLVQQGMVPAWMALVVVTREFLVSGLRMLAASKSLIIAASWSGKAKTVTTIIALALCLFAPALKDILPVSSVMIARIAYGVMWIAIVLTIASGVEYFIKCRSVFVSSHANQGAVSHSDASETRCLETSAACALDVSERVLAQRCIEKAQLQHVRIATAESCTGGSLCASLTSIPGASTVVSGAIVSYSNDVKMQLLHVDHDVLLDSSLGAVSEQCAAQMARGVLQSLRVTHALSVTGMAGPTSNEPLHPVGQVFIGLAVQQGDEIQVRVVEHRFAGSRSDVIAQARMAALQMLDAALEESF